MRDCKHLGEQLYLLKSSLCGQRHLKFPVFKCLLLETECTRNKVRHTQTERICLTCEFKEEVDE